MHPDDPEAKITKMKDDPLAHKAEHAVDLDTGAVVSVTVEGAHEGDPSTRIETLIEAAEQVEASSQTARSDRWSPTRAITVIR